MVDFLKIKIPTCSGQHVCLLRKKLSPRVLQAIVLLLGEREKEEEKEREKRRGGKEDKRKGGMESSM